MRKKKKIEGDIVKKRSKSQKISQNSVDHVKLNFSHYDGPVIILDPATRRIIDCNYPAEGVFGYFRSNLIGKDLKKLVVNKKQFESLDGDIVPAIKNFGFFQFEYLMRRENGENFPAQHFIYPFYHDGQIQYFIDIIKDLSIQKKSDNFPEEQLAKFYIIAEKSSDIIYHMALPDGRYEYVSPASLEITGYFPEEIYQKPWFIEYIIHPSSRQYLNDMKAGLIKGDCPQFCEYQIIHKSGEFRWLRQRNALVCNDNGRPVAIIGIITDITEQKQTKEALLKSEEKYREIVESVNDVVFRVDASGVITFCNLQLENLWGYRRDQIIGNNVLRFTAAGEENKVTRTLSAQEKFSKLEMTFITKNGSPIIFEVAGTPIFSNDGEFGGFYGVARDITERKQIEQKLHELTEDLAEKVKERTADLERTNILLENEIKYHEEAEKQIKASLNEKEVLLREIHHRVKNNLQIVISLLNLQSRHIQDKKILEALRECQNRIKAMAIVHEKLYQSHNISNINISSYIRDLSQILFHFYKINPNKVTLKVDAEDMNVDINSAIPIGLIINELMTNALKYAFPDGNTGEISISIRKDSGIITLAFKDNGIGIPADIDWKNLKSLGLRLVISLVEQLHGEIELRREEGTRFNIVLNEKKTSSNKNANKQLNY